MAFFQYAKYCTDPVLKTSLLKTAFEAFRQAVEVEKFDIERLNLLEKALLVSRQASDELVVDLSEVKKWADSVELHHKEAEATIVRIKTLELLNTVGLAYGNNANNLLDYSTSIKNEQQITLLSNLALSYFNKAFELSTDQDQRTLLCLFVARTQHLQRNPEGYNTPLMAFMSELNICKSARNCLQIQSSCISCIYI